MLTNFIKRSVLSQVVSVDTLEEADRNTYFFFRDDRLEDMGLDGKFNWISPLVIMGTTLHIYTPWFIYRHVKNYFGDSVTVEMINNSLFNIIKETFKVVNDINEMDDYLLYYEVFDREDEDEEDDDMNLQEQIRKVLREELNRPSEESFVQALRDVKPLIPRISHRIIDEDGLEHNEETVVRLNKMIFKKVKEGNGEVLDEMWELAGSRIIKNAINIITYYTK